MLRLRILVLLSLLTLSACLPSSPPLQLAEDCRAEFLAEQLVSRHWLSQPQIWRLRQAVLLEIGPKKIPLEGFLRLDLQRQEARLLAMNEMGLVLFDLRLTADEQKVERAIPQLQQVKGLAQGVAQSLRQIFLIPRPQARDRLEERGNSQRLWRAAEDGSLSFLFDCQGDLRETRQQNATGDWRVLYEDYRLFDQFYLPELIVLNDYRNSVKLSLWLREVKQEP